MSYTLIGLNGNAFTILSYVRKAMKRSGYSKTKINEYLESAKSGDYNHLLRLSQNMIERINQEDDPEC